MLRGLLLHMAENGRVQEFFTRSSFARRAARRFVAGEELSEAIAVIKELNSHGILATLDHLGEHVHTEAGAKGAAEEYLRILDAIHASGVKSHASLKLTQIGLDFSEALCIENLSKIAKLAKKYQAFVRIDMESSAYTERTLKIYEKLREQYDNVGVVIQAYLYRSKPDIERLIELGANVRLCKGAYSEPPSIAFPRKKDVDANFIELLKLLMSDKARSRGVYAAIATHDVKLIEWAKQFASEKKIQKHEFEFQMLYGIRRELQQSLAAEGYTVRVYVSYGREWYPYFMRRLAERPANVLFLLKHLVQR